MKLLSDANFGVKRTQLRELVALIRPVEKLHACLRTVTVGSTELSVVQVSIIPPAALLVKRVLDVHDLCATNLDSHRKSDSYLDDVLQLLDLESKNKLEQVDKQKKELDDACFLHGVPREEGHVSSAKVDELCQLDGVVKTWYGLRMS